MPDDSDVYLRIAQITASCISSIKPKKISFKARQYAPGSLEVMYNEAMPTRRRGGTKTPSASCRMP